MVALARDYGAGLPQPDRPVASAPTTGAFFQRPEIMGGVEGLQLYDKRPGISPAAFRMSSVRGGTKARLPPYPRRSGYAAGVATPTGAQSVAEAIAVGVPMPSMRETVPPPLSAPRAGI